MYWPKPRLKVPNILKNKEYRSSITLFIPRTQMADALGTLLTSTIRANYFESSNFLYLTEQYSFTIFSNVTSNHKYHYFGILQPLVGQASCPPCFPRPRMDALYHKQKTPGAHCRCAKRIIQSTRRGNRKGQGRVCGGQSLKTKTPGAQSLAPGVLFKSLALNIL